MARRAHVLLELSTADELCAPARRRAHAGSRQGRGDRRAGGGRRIPLGARAPMSCDFSLEHYRELLRAAAAGGYRWAGFERPPEPGDLLLRHDVDLSLEAALVLAEVEAEEGAWSTWFLMTRSSFYNLAAGEGVQAITRLRELGH